MLMIICSRSKMIFWIFQLPKINFYISPTSCASSTICHSPILASILKNFLLIYLTRGSLHLPLLIRIVHSQKIFNRNLSISLQHADLKLVLLLMFLCLVNGNLVIHLLFLWSIFILSFIIGRSIVFFLFLRRKSQFFSHLLSQLVKLSCIKFFFSCLNFCLCKV